MRFRGGIFDSTLPDRTRHPFELATARETWKSLRRRAEDKFLGDLAPVV